MKQKTGKMARWALICAVIPVVLAVVCAVIAGTALDRSGNWAVLILAVLVWTAAAALFGGVASVLGILALRKGEGRSHALWAVPAGLVEFLVGAATLIAVLS